MNGDLGDQPKSLLLCRKLVIRKEVLNMGLISEWVEVGLSGSSKQHYLNLGYEIPTRRTKYGIIRTEIGAKIKVKVTDLPNNSTALVDVECDCCKKIYQKKYYKYVLQNHDGKIYCKDCVHSVLHSGENNVNYNPNITDEEREIGRTYPEYVQLVKRVLARDNYTCQVCGKSISNCLQVHHLDGYSWCKEKRLNDTNCLTLCSDCHSSFHAMYGKENVRKEQFEEWIGYAVQLLKYELPISSSRYVYCIEKDKIYDSAKEACVDIGMKKDSTSVVRDVCNKKLNRACGLHFLWYDEYLKMTKDEIDEYVKTCDSNIYKKVICLETKEIFDKMKDASYKYLGTESTTSIVSSCRTMRGAGKLPDGTVLHWMYYNEYLNKIENNEEIIIPKSKRAKAVICTTTGEIFNQVKIAMKKYGIENSTISACCKGKQKTTKGLNGGIRLQWMYYSDFLNLPQEKQEEILNRNKDSSITDGSFIM